MSSNKTRQLLVKMASLKFWYNEKKIPNKLFNEMLGSWCPKDLTGGPNTIAKSFGWDEKCPLLLSRWPKFP